MNHPLARLNSLLVQLQQNTQDHHYRMMLEHAQAEITGMCMEISFSSVIRRESDVHQLLRLHERSIAVQLATKALSFASVEMTKTPGLYGEHRRVYKMYLLVGPQE